MRWIWIIAVILIMILPEAAAVAVAAEPATPPDPQAFGSLEALVLIVVGAVLVYLAALGRRAKRNQPKRVSNAPAFPQPRN